MNLTEATMLAIQGKLKLDESKEINSLSSSEDIMNHINDEAERKEAEMKKESIDVSVDDNGATIVETPEATVIVTDTQDVTEAPVEEVIVAEVPEEGETVVELPVEGDETIIPEEIVEPEATEEAPTIDEIVDGETEADEEDLEESKKPCETCGKEVCECEKVEESKEVVEEEKEIVEETVSDDFTKAKELLAVIFDAEATDETRADAKKSLKALIDTEKVEENVEIEVSEDGTEVEVKTDEGENVEVIDETEEPETSDEETTEEGSEDTEIIEVPEEETAVEEEEDDSEFIEESFEKALTEYYKENTKSIKGYKVENITKTEEGLKIEGILTNKLGKEVKTELKATKVQEGKFYSRYEIANIKGLLESKTSTTANLITKLTKENKLECSSIANKKLVK